MLNCLEPASDQPTTPASGKSAKLREAQLQLQRKLQQREHIKDQKHRHLDTVTQVRDTSNKILAFLALFFFLCICVKITLLFHRTRRRL